MTDIIVSLIAASASILCVIVANRGRQHSKAARVQVENSHNTNLRDELDQRHEQNVAKLDELLEWKREHSDEALLRDEHLAKNTERIKLLEDTLPKAPQPPPQRRRKKQ